MHANYKNSITAKAFTQAVKLGSFQDPTSFEPQWFPMVVRRRFCFLTKGQALTFIKKQNSNTDPCLGHFALLSASRSFHTSPIFPVPYPTRTGFLRWGMDEWGKPHCLLQDCILIWALPATRPLLNAQSELGRSLTSQTITAAPAGPMHWPSTTSAQDSVMLLTDRRNQESWGGRAEHNLPSCNCMAYNFSTECSHSTFKKPPN